MNGGPHPYQEISLSSAGMVLGIVMSLLYGLMLFKAEAAMAKAKKLPRDYQAGTWMMGIGMIWFWLLVAPPDKGVFSSLSMDLGEFNGAKKYLMIGVPLFCLGMIFLVREFLFVRGLGLCLLMAAGPLLYAGDFEPAPLRFLLPTVCYLMIIKGLYFVGMPYLFRDGVTWATESSSRWKKLSLVGFVVGVAILGCSLTLWRGY